MIKKSSAKKENTAEIDRKLLLKKLKSFYIINKIYFALAKSNIFEISVVPDLTSVANSLYIESLAFTKASRLAVFT
jgi:hypothetical protein